MRANESRQVLEKQYAQCEQQCARFDNVIEAKEQELKQVEERLSFGEQVKKLVENAEEEIRQLDERLKDLQDVLPIVESRAAEENSRQNSTEEIREMNRKIEEASLIERAADKMVSVQQTEIDILKFEIQALNSESTDHIQEVRQKVNENNETIQKMRNKISETRVKNLKHYIDQKNRVVYREIDLMQSQTIHMFYSQILSMFNKFMVGHENVDELAEDKQKADEFSQLFDEISGKIPQKNAVSYESSQAKMVQTLRKIEDLENKIMKSTLDLKNVEKDQDNKVDHISRLQLINRGLAEQIITLEEQLRTLKDGKEFLIKNDASKLQNSQNQIAELKKKKENLKQAIEQKEQKIAEMLDFSRKRVVKTSLEQLTLDIVNDVKENLQPKWNKLRREVQTTNK